MDEILIREIPLADAARVDALVSGAFGYKTPHHFFQDFPVWGSDLVHRYGIFKDEQLISHVGLRVTELDALSIGLIGAVATHPLHRGQGHSSKLLEHAIEIGRKKNLDWLVLWGSEHEFYSKFGFELAGTQSRVRVGDALESLKPTGNLLVHTGYTREIFTAMLYDTHSRSLRLKAADRAWFERHETVQWYWIGDPFSFVGFERGLDLPHLIHEWGGDPAALASLFRHVQQKDPAAELLTHPSLLPKLGLGPQTPQTLEKLCLAKPLSPSAVNGGWPDAFWISGLNAC